MVLGLGFRVVLGAGFRGLLAQAVIIVPRLGMSLNTQKNAEIWPDGTLAFRG